MTANKVCPVVLRHGPSRREILAFERPQAGCQLVKGSIETGESVDTAALRELAEESGITNAKVGWHLGLWVPGDGRDVWAFIECTPAHALPDSWAHAVLDGGGHTFRFFWHGLSGQPDASRWHQLFRSALAFIDTKA